jgi:glycosyltransferase 2 family protein
MNRKAVAVLVTKLVLSVALLLLVLAKVDVDSVLTILAKADRQLVLLWYSLVPVAIALSAWRWATLAPGMSFSTAVKYTWIGVFFGHVLPGSIAGDIAKGVSLALKDSSSRSGLAASIVADKVIGLAALMLFFDIACGVIYLLYGEMSQQIRHLAVLALVLSLIGLVAALVAALVALRSDLFAAWRPRGVTGRFAEGVSAAALYYRNKPSLIGKAFVISMVIHLVNIFATYLSFRALRVEGDLMFASVVYPVVSVMLLIPISISGIGVRDATLAVLFTLFGLSAASGVALSWLALLAVIPNVAIGGAVQLMEMYRKH